MDDIMAAQGSLRGLLQPHQFPRGLACQIIISEGLFRGLAAPVRAARVRSTRHYLREAVRIRAPNLGAWE